KGDTMFVRIDAQETNVTPANVLVGTTPDNAEHSITSGDLKFTVVSDGPHAGASNTVSRVAPAAGSIVAVCSTITIYVWNLTRNSTSTVTPTPSPSATPSPTPTPTAFKLQDWWLLI